MVNKLNGVFTKADEESFETFAIYCGLALHHAKVRNTEHKKVPFSCLTHHLRTANEQGAFLYMAYSQAYHQIQMCSREISLMQTAT